jgi:hypothetical protein
MTNAVRTYLFRALTRTLTQRDPACALPPPTVYSYHNIPNKEFERKAVAWRAQPHR